MKLKELAMKIPVFRRLSHWLLRIPLIIVFIQQGLSKMPVTQEIADAFGLPYIVWWFVAYGELGAGLGLLVGGLIMFTRWVWIGDLITRFSGFVIFIYLLYVIFTLSFLLFSCTDHLVCVFAAAEYVDAKRRIMCG